MGIYYHFTSMDNLYSILKSSWILPYSTHHKYPDAEFVSLTDDEYMLLGGKDARYDNYNVRIEVETEDVIKLEYTLDFFRRNPEISAYVFSDLNDDMDFLYIDGYFSDDDFNYLKKESEYLNKYGICIKNFKLITILNSWGYKYYRSNVSDNEIIKKMTELNIPYQFSDYW